MHAVLHFLLKTEVSSITNSLNIETEWELTGGKPGNFLVTGLGFPPQWLKTYNPRGGGSIMSPSQHNFVTAVNTKCTLQSSSSQLNYL
jgi:hypothetical protein